MQTITDTTFEEQVLKGKGLLLVDFWASWCGPCKNLMPILEEALISLGNKVKGFSLNIEENPLTPTQYNIMTIPTLILFHEGNSLDIHVGGGHTKEELISWVESNLKKISP